MRRLTLIVVVGFIIAWPRLALCQNYHTGLDLQCTDCHTPHASVSHDYPWLGVQPPDPSGGPHEHLLRNEPNLLCLSCHDNSTSAPDVMGLSASGQTRREAGALNRAAGHGTNDPGYEETDGHTLWTTATAPGGTWAPDPVNGLECINCHAQHGSATQYRNLLNRGIFTNPTRNLTFAAGTNNTTKDVWEHASRAYLETDVDFNEPDQTKSAYASWCKACHTNFHGTSGGPEVGGISGGNSNPSTILNPAPWVRHPNADVNIGTDPGLSGSGTASDSSSFISSYVQRYFTRTNRVKVMAPNNDWLPDTLAARVLTPSCFSCHKAHGNKNGFGLIFMRGATGSPTPTEEGDGGQYTDLCRQCHTEGSFAANP